AAVVVVTLFGLPVVVTATAAVAEVVFAVFFLRHFAFAVSALRSAPADLRTPVLRDGRYRPRVTVLVACKNEESVVEGMVASLLALDYPRDSLQLLVVDDGSTARTSALLDAFAAP